VHCIPVRAQDPEGFSVQGYLENDLGVPLSGSHSLTFNLYSVPEDGSVLLTETKDVGVEAGIFNTVVFSASAGLKTISFNTAYFLGISIAGGDELTPRMKLSSTPYALGVRGFYARYYEAGPLTHGYTVVAGDPSNAASASVIGGTISGGGGMNSGFDKGNSVLADWSTVSGGATNLASDDYSSVGGGTKNTASGYASTVPGGERNEASGDYSFAAGIRSEARNHGSFVWNSSSSGEEDIFQSTAVNQFLVRAPGGVGINENGPQANLHVEEADLDVSDAFLYQEELILEDTDVEFGLFSSDAGQLGSAISLIDVPGTSSVEPYSKWTIARRTSTTTSNPNVLTFRYGTNNDYLANSTQMWIGTDGHVHANSFDPAGGDVAEMFPGVGPASLFEPGDVLALSTSNPGAVQLIDSPYLTLISGVYATDPGIRLNREESNSNSDLPVGLVGVVPTKVTSENGPIQVGDLLVSSSTAGCAMKGTPSDIGPGMLLGKAMDTYSGTGIGKINVLLTLR
jgi:hypothetical protein